VKLRIIKNKYLSEVVNLFVSPKLLEQDIVFAGGFPAFLYSFFLENDGNLEKAFEKLKSDLDSGYVPFQFGDLDLFLFENSPLLKDPLLFAKPDLSIEESFAEEISNRFRELTDYEDSFISSMSRFSNTFFVERTSNETSYSLSEKVCQYTFSLKFQFIRNPIEDIKSLLERFDLTICQAAFYDDCLIISEELETSFSAGEISLSNSEALRNRLESDMDRLWTASRAFKYSSRYEFGFSQEMMEFIFRVYADLADFLKKDSPADLIGSGVWFDKFDEDPGYVALGAKPSIIEGDRFSHHKISHLINAFPCFCTMVNYDPLYDAYLIGCGISEIENYINQKHFGERGDIDAF